MVVHHIHTAHPSLPITKALLQNSISPLRKMKESENLCGELTARIILPDVENNSPAISISTVVTAPTAGCDTHARKWRTTSSYNLCKEKISQLLMTKDCKMTICEDQNKHRYPI